MPQPATNSDVFSIRERPGIPAGMLWPSAAVLLALSATSCVTSPTELGKTKVGVDAEWHSMDAGSANVEAIKQQKQQELWARQQPPLPIAAKVNGEVNGNTSTLAPLTTWPVPVVPVPIESSPSGSGIEPAAAEQRPAGFESPRRQAGATQATALSPAPPSSSRAAAKHDSMATVTAGYNEPESRPMATLASNHLLTSTEQSSLRFLGFVEDSQGRTAALLGSSPGGVQLVRLGDTVPVKDGGRDRELRVYEITSRELRLRNDHEEKTIYFRN